MTGHLPLLLGFWLTLVGTYIAIYLVVEDFLTHAPAWVGSLRQWVKEVWHRITAWLRRNPSETHRVTAGRAIAWATASGDITVLPRSDASMEEQVAWLREEVLRLHDHRRAVSDKLRALTDQDTSLQQSLTAVERRVGLRLVERAPEQLLSLLLVSTGSLVLAHPDADVAAREYWWTLGWALSATLLTAAVVRLHPFPRPRRSD